MLEINSMCKIVFQIVSGIFLYFPYLEKWTSKFPVFPVPWQPCFCTTEFPSLKHWEPCSTTRTNHFFSTVEPCTTHGYFSSTYDHYIWDATTWEIGPHPSHVKTQHNQHHIIQLSGFDRSNWFHLFIWNVLISNPSLEIAMIKLTYLFFVLLFLGMVSFTCESLHVEFTFLIFSKIYEPWIRKTT